MPHGRYLSQSQKTHQFCDRPPLQSNLCSAYSVFLLLTSVEGSKLGPDTGGRGGSLGASLSLALSFVLQSAFVPQSLPRCILSLSQKVEGDSHWDNHFPLAMANHKILPRETGPYRKRGGYVVMYLPTFYLLPQKWRGARRGGKTWIKCPIYWESIAISL